MRSYNTKINIIVNNFQVIEDLGRKFPKETSKTKAVFVKVKCITCEENYEGQLTHFKYGARKCLKCTPKTWKLQKNYEGEIHEDFKIIKDFENRERARKVRAQCLQCGKEYDGLYSNFKKLKRKCECKDALLKTHE